MKKNVLLVLLLVTGFAACLKDENNDCVPSEVNITAPSAEVNALKGILSGNGITTTEDPRGFFYKFTVTGTGAKPNTCNTVKVDYVAKLMTGKKVDSANGAVYPIKAFITGWQEALPLMPVGSTMTVYFPPSLAYGDKVTGEIPANSKLQFDITLQGLP
jgi:FKBP-type peptidyl-prolyl cis-trans isomerase